MKNCLESVYRFTVSPYKLYIVEQGSTDGTLEWLNCYQDAHPSIKMDVIVNNENVGFPKGCNQAFEVIEEERICLLNNDTIVSPYWLTRLGSWLSDENLVVGPSTNKSAQQVLPESRGTPINVSLNWVALKALAMFKVYEGKTRVLRQLTGFCMLFSGKVLEEYGVLDEAFLLGGGEEFDFCWRVTTSGKKCVWVKEVFVYHVHHATYDILGIDVHDYRKKTTKILDSKWPTRPSHPCRK